MSDVTSNEDSKVNIENVIAPLSDASMDDAVIIFKNPDKKTKVKIGPGDYMPYNGSRILMSGPPNSGKRNLILNIIWRMKPKPSAIHLCHCDPYTEEYDVITEMGIPLFSYGAEDFPTRDNILNPIDLPDRSPDNPGSQDIPLEDTELENDTNNEEIPLVTGDTDEIDEEIDEIMQRNKQLALNPLCIIDEITHDTLSPVGRARFERLINQVATHCNCTTICSIQSLLNISPKVRRGFNHYVLWKQYDKMLNQLVAQRSSIEPDILDDLFKLCSDKFDFIWIDLDAPMDSQWRYRLNYLYPIAFDRT